MAGSQLSPGFQAREWPASHNYRSDGLSHLDSIFGHSIHNVPEFDTCAPKLGNRLDGLERNGFWPRWGKGRVSSTSGNSVGMCTDLGHLKDLKYAVRRHDQEAITYKAALAIRGLCLAINMFSHSQREARRNNILYMIHSLRVKSHVINSGSGIKPLALYRLSPKERESSRSPSNRATLPPYKK